MLLYTFWHINLCIFLFPECYFLKASSFYILHLITDLSVVTYCNIIQNICAPGESVSVRNV